MLTNRLFALLPVLLAAFISMPYARAEVVFPPKFVMTGGMDGFSYWIAKHMVFDVDTLLKEQGFDLPVCTFRQRQPLEDISFRELGKCLMKNFTKSMDSDENPGTVYTWIRDAKGFFHPVEIRWRPPKGGWKNIISQIFEMKFEGGLYWVREKVWGPESSEKIRFKEFIMGNLEIILPDDPEALRSLELKGNLWVQNYLKNMKSLSLELKSTGNEKGQVIYNGMALVQMKSTSGDASSKTQVQIRTNVNVMLMKRPFFLESKIKTTGSDLLKLGAKP